MRRPWQGRLRLCLPPYIWPQHLAAALARPDTPVLTFFPQTAKTRHSATQVPDVARVLSSRFWHRSVGMGVFTRGR